MATLPDYHEFGGTHPEAAALRNVLAYEGQSLSEAMVLGIGGGIGLTYMVFEFGETPTLALLARNPGGDLIRPACERLGLALNVLETGGKKAAFKNLTDILDAGHPAIVWVAPPGLPYYGVPIEWIKWWNPVPIVVYGIEDNEAQIADLPRTPQTATLDELAMARGAQPYVKHRMMVVEPGAIGDLFAAIRSGIRACIQDLTEPPIANFGIKGIAKWAELMVNPRDKKGWTKVFASPAAYFHALRNVYSGIEQSGTGGGALRGLYAAFLDEASGVLGSAAAKQAAVAYRECAGLWSAFACAALPDDVPTLRETRDLMAKRHALFCAQGGEALADMALIDARLEALKAERQAHSPMDAAAIKAHREALHHHLMRIHAAETNAVNALQAI
jgi:hypothetical protein